MDRAEALARSIVHGDRPPGTARTCWYCSACEGLVDDGHDCLGSIAENVRRLDAELGAAEARPPHRENQWLAVHDAYNPPRRAQALDVEEGAHRYLTARWWIPAPSLVCFVLFNPAPLHAKKSAIMLDRCMGLARGWGFGGVALVNLYSLVLVEPDDVRSAGGYGLFDAVGSKNDMHIREAAKVCATVVCAWGCKPWARGRVQAVLQGPLAGRQLHALGFGDHGDPLHPIAIRPELGRYAQPFEWVPSS